MAIKESDIKTMMKTVMSTTMKTVSSGQKAIISPTEIRNITKEIVADAESGSIARFEKAIDKTKTVLDKLDIDLKDFNTSLAKRIKDLDEQKDKSYKEVEQLRSQNIIAEVKVNDKRKQYAYETNILTNKEIADRLAMLEKRKKLFEGAETKVLKIREKILASEEPLNKKQRETIIRDEERLQKEKDAIKAEEDVLTPLSKKDDMAGPSSSFYQALKEPFIAVGDAFMSLKDIGTDVVRVFKFFSEGGLTKGLKSFKKGVMALGKFFMSTKVLIGLAIAGVIAGIVYFRDEIKAVANFIMGIPQMIGDFIKKAFTRISDFFKDMINVVIKLINKIPGINIPLLETSTMKEEKEEAAKQERIKQGAKEFSGDVEVNTESGFTDKGTYLQPNFSQSQGFDDGAGMGNEQSNIVYDKGSKSAMIMNRQVVGDQLRGSGATGTGDASTAKTLYQESKQASMYDTGEVPPVIINNSNQSNVNSSGSTTVGFTNNKNIDDTFTNLNYVMP
ncbi:hypothetical protein N9J01_00510 [bacterium]|nr:hypothetical protein [bacterium]